MRRFDVVWKRISWLTVILLMVATPCTYAQKGFGAVGKQIARAGQINQKVLQTQLLRAINKPMIPLSPLSSSRVLREQYLLVSNNLNVLREVYAQRGAEVLLGDEKISDRLTNLSPLNQEASLILSALTQKQKRLLAVWEQALLRERNPHFLPKKNPADLLMFEVSPVQKMRNLAVSPRFFREWAALIDQSEFGDISETAGGLVGALRNDLIKLEQDAGYLSQVYLEAKAQAEQETNSPQAVAVAKKKMNIAKGALTKVFHQAAQDVLDLVHILKLYPSVSEDLLKILANKLDAVSEENAFIKILRTKIGLPQTVQKPKKRIGFTM